MSESESESESECVVINGNLKVYLGRTLLKIGPVRYQDRVVRVSQRMISICLSEMWINFVAPDKPTRVVLGKNSDTGELLVLPANSVWNPSVKVVRNRNGTCRFTKTVSPEIVATLFPDGAIPVFVLDEVRAEISDGVKYIALGCGKQEQIEAICKDEERPRATEAVSNGSEQFESQSMATAGSDETSSAQSMSITTEEPSSTP